MKRIIWRLLSLACMYQVSCFNFDPRLLDPTTETGVEWSSKPSSHQEIKTNISSFNADKNSTETAAEIKLTHVNSDKAEEEEIFVPDESTTKLASNLSDEKILSQDIEWNTTELNDTNLEESLLNTTQSEFQDIDGIFANITSDYYDDQDNKSSTRLLGGTAAVAGEYPFAVYVASINMQRGCSGVILSTTYILTAASCVYDATSVAAYPGEIAPVAATPFVTGSAIIHPHFYLNRLEHDIALVKLATPLTFSGTVNRIRLAKKHYADDYHDLTGKSVRVFGFGLEATTGGTAPVLRVARMNVLSLSQCYKGMRTANIKPSFTQNCLDTEGGTVGMCSSVDIGGPVLYRFKDDTDYTLVGILSYFQMCRSSVPNLFTRIGPYVDFIEKYIPNFLSG